MIRVGSPQKTRQHVQLSLRAINSHTSWLVNLPLPDIPPLRNEGLIKPYQGKRMVNARGVGWLAMNTVATAVNLQGPTLLVDAETKVWIWLGEFSTMFSLFLGGPCKCFKLGKWHIGWGEKMDLNREFVCRIGNHILVWFQVACVLERKGWSLNCCGSGYLNWC